jgi:dUTP pyrophosphatase
LLVSVVFDSSDGHHGIWFLHHLPSTGSVRRDAWNDHASREPAMTEVRHGSESGTEQHLSLGIAIRRLDPDLPLPSYARPGDAGADLVARVDVTLAPGGGRAAVPTGIAMAIPAGFAGFVQPRSGLALRHGVTCLNTPGLIDAGYRDELAVLLINTDPVTPYEVRRGDRVAQLVIQRVETARFDEVSELPDSERGLGGFGSTGR